MIMTILVIVFTAIIIICLLLLVQALVKTELQMARDRLANKQTAVSKQDEEFAALKKRQAVYQSKIKELEESRQDLFNYVIKQEKMMEDLRVRQQPDDPSSSTDDDETPKNNGTPQV